MLRSRFAFIAVHIIFPLLLGGLIYICWRDQNLLMFRWFDLAGLEPLIAKLRIATTPLQVKLPIWFQFSLPDALWVYALTAFMALVWKGRDSRLKFAWLSMGLLLGAGSELGQLAGLVPGVFDPFDFFFCLSAAGLALVATSKSITRQRSMNEAAT
jgi:hypothetical protein